MKIDQLELQGCLKYVIRIPLKYELGYGLG